jgi:arylsulfatase A-like enzyme
VGAYNSQYRLNPSAHTLAERLTERGYTTAAIVSNPVLSRGLGLDQGFDLYDDEISGEGVAQAKSRTARNAVDLALAWLAQRGAGPFFLWLHMNDAHGPYDSSGKWSCPIETPDSSNQEGNQRLQRGRDHSGYRAIPLHQVFGQERAVEDYRHRYDCEVAFADDQLGRLLDSVWEAPDLANSLIIVTADHGEAMGEDDFYFSHGHAIGLDQVRVPLILAGPGVARNEVSRQIVSNVSIFDTVLDFAGIEAEEDPARRSLLSATEDLGDTPVFVESLNQIGVAYRGRFLRRDLRPPSDERFWRRGNPNSGGGVWRPLGGDTLEAIGDAPGDSSAGAAIELDLELAALLDENQERIVRERAMHAGLRSGRALSSDEIEALKQLGYINGSLE